MSNVRLQSTTIPMKTLSSRFLVIAMLALACVAYVSYRIGHIQASRQGVRSLAFVSLWSVKPSVQTIEYATATPGIFPEGIQVTADGSIYMVARYSMVFDPDFTTMDEQTKGVLCTIAKNREIYRKRSPDLYDEALMSHLAKVHGELAPQLAQAKLKNPKAGCNV
jgi:hypothetical protein